MKQVVSLTRMASTKLAEISKQAQKPYIRFYVKGGGCNGFNYKFEPTFDPPQGLDEVVNDDKAKLFVCESSVMHLLGTKVDWKKDVMGEGFHFENPMAQSKCGCGTSFSSKAL